jgi:hypothetical protein
VTLQVNLPLPDEVVEALAERVAELLAERNGHAPEPWLDVRGAAEHLSVSVSEIYTKCSRRDLDFPCHKEGRKSFFIRHELDAWRLNHNTPNGGSRP